MVMIDARGKRWYEDKTWLSNLNASLDAMKYNDDLFIVVDGEERSGKSQRMRQIGAYCAEYLGTTFSDENIKQDLQEYMDFSIESPKYTVCILDESRNQLNRKNANSKLNKHFTNFLSECGKYNQVHIIALPAFHDLDKSIVLWRMKFLVHIHKWFEESKQTKSGYKLARGSYTLYINGQSLKYMYHYPYLYPKRWETKGDFSNVEVLDEEELKRYEAKKDINIEKRYHSKNAEEDISKTEKKWRTRFVKAVELLTTKYNETYKEIAESTEMNYQTLSNTMVRYKEEGE